MKRTTGEHMAAKYNKVERWPKVRTTATALLFVVASVMSGSAYCQAQVERHTDTRLVEGEQKKTPPNYFQLSRVATNAGMNQLMLGNYAEAERTLQQALDLIRKIPARPIPLNPQLLTGTDVAAYQDAVARVTFEGTIAHNLGQVFFRQKKYKEAEPMYKISTAAAEANPHKTSLKEYLADLEALYVAMGNEQLAKETRSRIKAAEAKR
jgi:tetratricopeptide (TPR) repeat protein